MRTLMGKVSRNFLMAYGAFIFGAVNLDMPFLVTVPAFRECLLDSLVASEGRAGGVVGDNDGVFL